MVEAEAEGAASSHLLLPVKGEVLKVTVMGCHQRPDGLWQQVVCATDLQVNPGQLSADYQPMLLN